ncbi:MAG: hypothetical protein ACU83N_16400 [Gammaproteobacteria bacterium]
MAQGTEHTVSIFGKRFTVMEIVKDKDEHVRLEAVDQCFALRELVEDPSELVRMAVARKGVGHETLVVDTSWRVRATVAKYSQDDKILNRLIADAHDFVRFVLVKRRYALESFLLDPDEEIAFIARQEIKVSV